MSSFPLYLVTGQAFYFSVCLFVGIACLAASWLSADAWWQRRSASQFWQSAGFILLTGGFLMAGVTGESGSWILTLSSWLRIAGYLAVATSAIIEPIQSRPNTAAALSAKPAAGLTVIPVVAQSIATVLLPLTPTIAAVAFWRRAHTGLETHLRPVSLAFGILGLAELLATTSVFSTTTNPVLQNLTAAYSWIWIITQLLYCLGAVVLAAWVWRYLIRRPHTQLFFITDVLVTVVTLLVTVSSISLTMSNVQATVLAGLQTSASVLRDRLDSQGATSLAAAKVVSLNPAVIAATAGRDHAGLRQHITLNPLGNDQYMSEIIIIGPSGDVLYRASDPDRYGDLLASNSLAVRSLGGATATGTIATGSSANSGLAVASTTPVTSNGTVIGAVITLLNLNNAFVDGLKRTTGLDSTIYAGDQRVATTLSGPNGLTRDIGAHESSSDVKQAVLEHGHRWSGMLYVSNRPYLMSFQPLTDIDNRVVGMLSIGQLQSDIIRTTSQAITYTRLAAVGWLMLALWPIFILTQQIARQLR